jgi:hypothetical protein
MTSNSEGPSGVHTCDQQNGLCGFLRVATTGTWGNVIHRFSKTAADWRGNLLHDVSPGVSTGTAVFTKQFNGRNKPGYGSIANHT